MRRGWMVYTNRYWTGSERTVETITKRDVVAQVNKLINKEKRRYDNKK